MHEIKRIKLSSRRTRQQRCGTAASPYTIINLSLKENDTVQIHFNYSYKLRIFFHTVGFAYDKMKDAYKIWCF